MIKVLIKNKYSSDWNNKAIKKAIASSKIDINKIKTIYITDRIVNFVTE